MKMEKDCINGNIKLRRFTSFESYDELDSPVIITDGNVVEVWEYLDGIDGAGKRIHEAMWSMKGDEFGSSQIGTPTHFIRQSEFLKSMGFKS